MNGLNIKPVASSRRRGVALLTTIIITIVMIALSFAWMATAMSRAAQTRAITQKTRVNQMAEAGLNAAIADLAAGGTGTLGVGTEWNPQYDDTGGPGPHSSTIGVGDGIPTWGENYVSLVPLGNDGGYYTFTEEVAAGGDAYHIWASAFQNGVTSTIEAVVERFELPGFPGAVYLQYPDVSLSFNGAAFTVDGHDTNWDDTPGSSSPLPGVATPWDSSSVALTVPAQQEDQIMGAGGLPSIGACDYLDLREIAESIKPLADVVVPGGTYTGDWGDARTGDFQIVYVNGDFHQSGAGTGAGILVVDGEMRLSGAFTWYGAVIVLGRVEVVGGGGTKHVYGTVFVGDDVVEVSETSVSEFGISGTSDLTYSSESERALQLMLTYRLVFWAQHR